MHRRAVFQLAASLVTAANATSQTQRPPAAQRVSKEQIVAALKLLGLEFQEAEVDMMLSAPNRMLSTYESLRSLDIPLDTEPAIAFHPGLPGRAPDLSRARFQPSIAKAKSHVAKPANLEELAFLSVTELAPLIRARRVTSTDLTKMYLTRLKRFGPQLNCVVTLTEDLAMEQAAAADAEIRRRRYRGPLHGIPWGAKDLFATKGIKTTWGAEPFRDQVIDYNATVVDRLQKAGAVLVAKLSMGALAQGGLWFGGMTKTPWNVEQTSSGSSAGSASATAAGLVGFTLGTETLGSIVSPSIRCGTTGLRPTYGRVSRFGAMGLSWTMDKVGPICRAVEDCALVLHAIYGPDGHDRTVAADAFHWEPHKPLSGLRVAVLQKAFDSFKDEAEKKIYADALSVIGSLGVKMTPIEATDEDAQRLRFVLTAEAAAAFDDITRNGRVRELKGQSPGDWPNTFRGSRLIPAVEYLRAQRGRTLLVAKMEKFFADWDVIVTPPYTLLTTTNLTGYPQVVLPCGFGPDGMPRSISFLGKLYDEGSPLRLARAYQLATKWHKRQPPMAAVTAIS